MRSVTRGSFTSSVEPGGWEAAGRWTTSCTSSRGRSEFFPKITWSSREPGGKETKQSHDMGASAILQWRQEREGAVGGEKIDGNELSQVTTSCKLTNHKSLTVCLTSSTSEPTPSLTITCWVRRNTLSSHSSRSHTESVSAGALPVPFTQGLGGQSCAAEHFTHSNLPKSHSHLALLSLTPRVCDQRYRFRSGNRAAKSDAAGGRVRRRSSVRLGVRHRDKARLATKPVATCHSAPSFFFKKSRQCWSKREESRANNLQTKTKKNATASFSCLPSLFINSAARAGGRPGGGRLETASHVTEQSKGMYLKVSSRLATSTAHRPHLPTAAQRSKQAWIRTKPLITSLPLLRLFGTAAKPAASAAAAHTGESHSGPCTGIPPRLFP